MSVLFNKKKKTITVYDLSDHYPVIANIKIVKTGEIIGKLKTPIMIKRRKGKSMNRMEKIKKIFN